MTTSQNQSDVRIKAALAFVIAVGFFAVVAGLFVTKSIDGSIKDVLLVMLGALITSFKEITGFFFGSSSGSAAKSAAIERSFLEKQPNADNPMPVTIDTTAKPVDVEIAK